MFPWNPSTGVSGADKQIDTDNEAEWQIDRWQIDTLGNKKINGQDTRIDR